MGSETDHALIISNYRLLFTIIAKLYNSLVPFSWLRQQLASDIGELSTLSTAVDRRTIAVTWPDSAFDIIFRRRWKHTTRGMLQQWQMMNYVSAVFIGYVYYYCRLFGGLTSPGP